MSTIFYLRVSTDAQSLARQEALAASLSPDKVYREKLSGKSMHRPELKALLDYVRDGDVLHVESISRLARSTRDLLSIVDQLTAKGVEFISHKESIDTTTPQGRFVLTIFAALAELERETTLERAREGLDAARSAGVVFGRKPAKLPSDWRQIVQDMRSGKLTAAEAMRKTGLSKTTFYKYAKSG